MRQTQFDENDVYISISSPFLIKFDWSAQYSNNTSLLITLQMNSVLEGGEILEVKFINSKKYRGEFGG